MVQAAKQRSNIKARLADSAPRNPLLNRVPYVAFAPGLFRGTFTCAGR